MDLFAVEEAVAVGVGIVRIGADAELFFVRQAVAVGIEDDHHRGFGILLDAVRAEAVEEADVDRVVEFGVVAGQVDARVETERPAVVDVVHEAAARAERKRGGLVHYVFAVGREASAEDEIRVDPVPRGEVEHRVTVEHEAPGVVEILVALRVGLRALVVAADAVGVVVPVAVFAVGEVFVHLRGEDGAQFEAPPFAPVVADADGEVERVFKALVAFEVPEADAGGDVPAAEIGIFERGGRRSLVGCQRGRRGGRDRGGDGADGGVFHVCFLSGACVQEGPRTPCARLAGNDTINSAGRNTVSRRANHPKENGCLCVPPGLGVYRSCARDRPVLPHAAKPDRHLRVAPRLRVQHSGARENTQERQTQRFGGTQRLRCRLRRGAQDWAEGASCGECPAQSRRMCEAMKCASGFSRDSGFLHARRPQRGGRARESAPSLRGEAGFA